MTDWEAGLWPGPVAEPEPEPRVAWEDPELSGLAGFYRTLRDLLWRPAGFFQNLGRGGWAEPLAFALIVSSAGLLCFLFWHLLVLAPASPDLGEAAGRFSFLGMEPGALMVMMAATPLLVLINLGVGSLCWWGSVVLMGANRDFTPAWRVYGYAQGAMALAVIPVFGMLVAGVWVLVLMYYGVRQVYGMSVWDSLGTLAVFLLLQVFLALTVFLLLAVGLVGLGFLLLLV